MARIQARPGDFYDEFENVCRANIVTLSSASATTRLPELRFDVFGDGACTVFPLQERNAASQSAHIPFPPPRPLRLRARTGNLAVTIKNNQMTETKKKKTLERRGAQDGDEIVLPYHTGEIRQPFTRSD